MSDDTSKAGPQDRSCINIHQDYELNYWNQHFGVTKERLKAAVEKVGPSGVEMPPWRCPPNRA